METIGCFQMEIKINNTKPLFAHDVGIINTFRTEKTKKNKIKKESFTEIVFIDGLRKEAVVRVVVPFGLLKALPKLFSENVKKIKKELKSKEIINPDNQKIEIKSTNASYLG